jgi:integrase
MEHLDRGQVIRLLRAARAASERDWVLVLVTFWHGLRASEAIRLTPENFACRADRRAGGYIEVRRLKGSLRTVQPLVSHHLRLLDEARAVPRYIGELGKRGADTLVRADSRKVRGAGKKRAPAGRGATRLFPISRIQFWRLVRRYGAAAGLPRHLCHPHALKHSIAMQSIARAGIENVRQYLGHKSISSTGAYLRVDDAAASRAVLRAAGKRRA